ncbi:hypothetical protein lpa_00300 [Legionella pneumophila 2300/99 Alcoy]|nr:hypothetical protein lpa_00300 [Legionella pneumophila 2300/99 Alcoy]
MSLRLSYPAPEAIRIFVTNDAIISAKRPAYSHKTRQEWVLLSPGLPGLFAQR